jgi:ABC-type amino acid transport system permease subunit
MDDLRLHALETAVIFTTPEFTAEMARAGIRATAAPGHSQVLYLAPD